LTPGLSATVQVFATMPPKLNKSQTQARAAYFVQLLEEARDALGGISERELAHRLTKIGVLTRRSAPQVLNRHAQGGTPPGSSLIVALAKVAGLDAPETLATWMAVADPGNAKDWKALAAARRTAK
jgi:hypothetical protein